MAGLLPVVHFDVAVFEKFKVNDQMAQWPGVSSFGVYPYSKRICRADKITPGRFIISNSIWQLSAIGLKKRVDVGTIQRKVSIRILIRTIKIEMSIVFCGAFSNNIPRALPGYVAFII